MAVRVVSELTKWKLHVALLKAHARRRRRREQRFEKKIREQYMKTARHSDRIF